MLTNQGLMEIKDVCIAHLSCGEHVCKHVHDIVHLT